MSFSEKWDGRFRNGQNHSHWPWSDLVSICLGRVGMSSQSVVLELGSAVGANVPFFQALGCEYYGLEGSATAVTKTRELFPNWADRFYQCDFTEPFPIESKVSTVVDRSSVTHNTTAGVRSVVQQCYDVLEIGGMYVGIDWFGKDHDAFRHESGTVIDDNTRIFDRVGTEFEGVGNVHFSDPKLLRSLFSDFEMIFMEEKIVKCLETDKTSQTFNFVAKKQ